MTYKDFFLEIGYWIRTTLVVFACSLLITVFVLQPYEVNGSSMEPTFIGEDPHNKEQEGDRVFIFKTPYLLGSEPKYGDMVVIDSGFSEKRTIIKRLKDSPLIRMIDKTKQDSDSKYWIKRVIGEAGDTLEFIDGYIYRNGVPLAEPYIIDQMVFPFEPVEVPEGHVFLMGDNRNNSYDSRQVGPIPTDHVVGKVSFRYYPFNRMTMF
ncbi:signal peptidase I [Desulfuribacillus stibiiarsenatis]|uniref:Signal peptidase I n=1 Tax=Desulfuribacillus stibiiarsenatis TaxID=1390249 RepID=A0A1E5L2F0_9FIRM|nr:signal peptidase I [Desulfuribacillus stibiiarsenatis]OEH84274.1 signal peptidase I [Desulfuribacillus stibiiarsenatis]